MAHSQPVAANNKDRKVQDIQEIHMDTNVKINIHKRNKKTLPSKIR